MDKEKISLGTGLGVFFLGVGLLLLTFYIAYTVFTNPGSLAGFAELAPDVGGGAGQAIGPVVEMISYVVAALLLWVMGSVSGRIAKHGIYMYLSREE